MQRKSLTDSGKCAIRAAFSRAAGSYDNFAILQRRIAEALLERCPAVKGIALDAGSGTGYAAQALYARAAGYIALDHAIGMASRTSAHGICADIEILPLRSASIDLYFSSLAWQWVDARLAIEEAARVLQPGGELIVATLTSGTLHELRESFRQADDRQHVRQFDDATIYRPLLEAAGFERVRIERETFRHHAQDLPTILHELRALGAHVLDTPRPAGLYGARAFRRAVQHYETLREKQGLPVSYDVLFISATHKT